MPNLNTQLPQIMRTAAQLSSHASQRMGLTAQNVAQADTPNYRSRDLPSFSTNDPGIKLHQTRTGHLPPSEVAGGTDRMISGGGTPSPNGNDVSLEREMLRTVEIRQQHDMALSVYRSTLGIMRTALGRAR